jgi:enoyl-CoA hydratase
MDRKNILFEKENQIGFVTLNRPEVYNALNAGLLRELGETLEQIRNTSDIGVVILTGAGEKAFTSGGDIPEIPTSNALLAWETSQGHQSILNQLERLGKPSIAAINGYCLGGGWSWRWPAHFALPRRMRVWDFPNWALGSCRGMGGHNG